MVEYGRKNCAYFSRSLRKRNEREFIYCKLTEDVPSHAVEVKVAIYISPDLQTSKFWINGLRIDNIVLPSISTTILVIQGILLNISVACLDFVFQRFTSFGPAVRQGSGVVGKVVSFLRVMERFEQAPDCHPAY